MRAAAPLFIVGGLLALVACSSDNDPGMDGPPSAPMGRCGAVVQQHKIEGQTHVDTCSYIAYRTRPPSSGNHYPNWAAYSVYGQPVPEGFWVHDLEHGAIVISYNCGDAGCAGDVAAAVQMVESYPSDPSCDTAASGVRSRMLLTPDPHLDVPFAASAWGWTLRANCFDPDAFTAFAEAHYGKGPEPVCANGVDPIGTLAKPGCGEKP
jgi:hypothetical protein